MAQRFRWEGAKQPTVAGHIGREWQRGPQGPDLSGSRDKVARGPSGPFSPNHGKPVPVRKDPVAFRAGLARQLGEKGAIDFLSGKHALPTRQAAPPTRGILNLRCPGDFQAEYHLLKRPRREKSNNPPRS